MIYDGGSIYWGALNMALLGLQKVMLVDADEDIISQCERVLKRCGVTQITKLKRLRSAGARLTSTDSTDLLIIDVDMKELDGESISSLLMSGGNSEVANIPVLFIATVKSRADVQALQNVGCYHFLMKPLNDNILESKVREINERSFDGTKEQELVFEVKASIEGNKLAQAENILKPILRKYPTSPKFQTLLAEIVFCRGDSKTANIILEKVLQSDAGFEPALELRAKLRAKVAAEKKAKADAAASEQKSKLEAQIMAAREMALKYVAEGVFDKAESCFVGLLSKCVNTPLSFSVKIDLGSMYVQWGRLDKARAVVEDLQRASPQEFVRQIESLLAQLVHEEERTATEMSQKGYAYAELAKATDFPLPQGAIPEDFESADDERILKYIMFERKL